jgi:Ca-activated chloride channel family protein
MSTENQSPWDDDRVTAYVLNELSPSDRTQFEQEMADDETLAEAVRQSKNVTDQLSTYFAGEATPGLSKRHRAAIINEPVITRPVDEPRGRPGHRGLCLGGNRTGTADAESFDGDA